jgi:tetratricopeptide (TPR) repeat protein
MSKYSFTAIALAAVLAVGSYGVAPAALAGQDKPTVSRAASKPLKEAQEAAQAKNYDLSIAKAKEALALPNKTPYDTFVSNQMLAFAYARQGNNAAAAQAMEAQLDSGFTSAQDQATIMKALASVAYQQKDYAKSAEFGQRMIKAGTADAEMYTLIAQSYYLQGNYKQAAGFLSVYVIDQERRGVTPKEQSLQLIVDSYSKMGDNTSATNWLEKMVGYYPKPNYWNNLLYTMIRSDGNTDRHTLNIYRLMQDTKTLKQGTDYTEMAQIALDQGTPGEAVTVIEQGMAAGAFEDKASKDRNQRLLDSARKAATTDKAGMAKFEAEARSAKTGDADIALGRGFLSYGMNDKAEEAFARGIGKGVSKNLDEAQMLLGISQLRQGKKDQSVATFKGIKTTDATFQRLAKLWSLHAGAA